MATPTSRFTFFHSSLPVEGVVVKDPVGWNDVDVSLTFSTVYNSRVEFFKGNFMWFGEAMKILKAIELSDGFNAVVSYTIELSYRRNEWIELTRGTLKIPQLEEILIARRRNYKMTVPIIKDNFWVRLTNHFETQFDLESTEAIDGTIVATPSKIVLPMPSQKIRVNFEGNLGYGICYIANELTTNDYIQMDVDKIVISEIEQKYTLPNLAQSTRPVSILDTKYEGSYVFNLRIEMSVLYYDFAPCDVTLHKVPTSTYVEWYIQKNDEAAILFSVVDGAESSVYTCPEILDTNASDHVRIYAVIIDSGWEALGVVANLITWGEDNSAVPIKIAVLIPPIFPAPCTFAVSVDKTPINIGDAPSAEAVPTFYEINADTLFPETSTDAFLIKDAAESLLSKITGISNVLKSDYLDTCKGKNAIFRGKHLRGYGFDEKQMSMSLKEWCAGAFNLLNLGMGYTKVGEDDKIEIEDRSFFFNPVPVVNISNVNKLTRRYDLERIYKSIQIGFKDGVGSESESGIDDTQTMHWYNNDFNSVGEDFKVICEWMAASLALERSRRNRVELDKDDKNDEKIMVVALVEDGDDWLPEFGTAFNAVTNLLNSDFRINIRHSVAHVFNRFKKWLNGCMLYSTTGSWKFTRGEGNYEMTSQFEVTDCEATNDPEPIIDEGADIPATSEIDYVPMIYEAEDVPMSFWTYQDIIANKNNALGISRTDAGHVPMHILDLNFTIFKGKSKLLLLQATENGL